MCYYRTITSPRSFSRLIYLTILFYENCLYLGQQITHGLLLAYLIETFQFTFHSIFNLWQSSWSLPLHLPQFPKNPKSLSIHPEWILQPLPESSLITFPSDTQWFSNHDAWTTSSSICKLVRSKNSWTPNTYWIINSRGGAQWSLGKPSRWFWCMRKVKNLWDSVTIWSPCL